MAHQHNINPDAAQALVAEIRSQWPTASMLDWTNTEASDDGSHWGGVSGVLAGQLFDADGEHLVYEHGDHVKLQEIVARHAEALGWHEADLDAAHFFYLPEARDVTDGEDGWMEIGFKHPGWEFLER